MRRKRRRNRGKVTLFLWVICIFTHPFFKWTIGLFLPSFLAGLSVGILFSPAQKGLFQQSYFKENCSPKDSTFTFTTNVFSKNDAAQKTIVYIKADAPIISLTSIDKLGEANYYKIHEGGVGKTYLKIDLGAMQNMTKRKLILGFKVNPKLKNLEIWNEKYIAKPFHKSISILKKIITFGGLSLLLRFDTTISMTLLFKTCLTTWKMGFGAIAGLIGSFLDFLWFNIYPDRVFNSPY